MDYYNTIDIGVNFAGPKYTKESISKIMKDSIACSVDKVISISNSLKEIPINKELSVQDKNIYYTVGVHPHDAKSINKTSELQCLTKYLDDKKCVAIGECGLDYNRMFSTKEKQMEVFEYQIEIAKKHNKPLYMHCRDAFDDFIKILEKHKYFNGVVHCFTGNKEQAEKLVSLGFYLGITGWLLDKKRNNDLYEAIKYIPLDKLMVETDAPWLSVDKSRPSHPIDTVIIVAEIAKIKKLDEIQLGNIIYINTKNFFKL
jgi:TatD DNase family protein